MMFSAIYSGGGELTKFENEEWFACLFWM